MARLREASAPHDLDVVRALFAEYARSVDEPCCFAGFERELADLPRGYLILFLSYEEAVPAGCVGLREVDRGTAEMKRLYVRSAWRGRGLGRALAEAAIAAARLAAISGSSWTRCRRCARPARFISASTFEKLRPTSRRPLQARTASNARSSWSGFARPGA